MIEKITVSRADTDSAAIQYAVDLASQNGIGTVIIPRINPRTGNPLWIIDKTVRLPSDITVVLDGCFMQMADGVVGGFFCSETLFTEKQKDKNSALRNIKIIGRDGATLDGGKPTGLGEDTQKERGVPVRLNIPIHFINVNGFHVEGIKISNQRYWGMCFRFCSEGVIRNVEFDICRDRRNQDGINLRNGCHHITIENISGQTGDDMIALSAIDTDRPTGFNVDYPLTVDGLSWDIHDVNIKNISGCAIRHPLVALRNHNGARMYNIIIENVRDTAPIRPAFGDDLERYSLIVVGNNSYAAIRPAEMGETENIFISDVYCAYSSRVIMIQSVLRNSSFGRIHAAGECRSVIATTPDGWASSKSGVKLENVTLESVHFSPDCKETAALLDFSVMRQGDYVKNLQISGIHLNNVDTLAYLDEVCDSFDLVRGNIFVTDGKELRIERRKHYDELPSEREIGVWYAGDKFIQDCRRIKK